MTNEVYDTTIVGAGPVGMFAAFYAGLRDAKVQLLESLATMGGQVNALYPEKELLDVAAFPKVKGSELIRQLDDQLNGDVDVAIKLNTKVLDIVKHDDYFEIKTNQGTSRSRSVILAQGNGAFKPRKLQIDNADQFENKKLFYSIQNLDQFKGKDVMVAGGGDSAVDMALMLEPVAKSVAILHRRNEFRGLEKMVDKLNASSIKVLTPYLIKDLQDDGDKLKVTAKKVGDEDETMIKDVDDLVVNYGFISNNREIKSWGIKPEMEHRLIKVDQQMQTSVPMVYAIGDGAVFPGKETIIATGFGEVPTAVNEIMKKLYPDRRMPIHSTAMKPKKRD